MFITINGKTHYLWRAVDQHGDYRRGITSRFATGNEVVGLPTAA